MGPLVSVIVPVYNVLPFLREALDSVISQTYKNLEIIVVDDGSTDGSGEVCDEYLSDPRVIVIHQENRSLGGARNAGLDRATGEFVAFLDSDDAFTPSMIEKMLVGITRNNADICMCGFRYCRTAGRMDISLNGETKVFSPGPEQILSSAEALNRLVRARTGWPVAWNKLYRQSIWNGIRFPEGCLYEDIQTMCPVFEKCSRIFLTPDILMDYRVRKNSITQSFSLRHLRDSLLCSTRVEEFIDMHCPALVSQENAHAYRERSAVSASRKYAALLWTRTPRKDIYPFRKEIIQQWEKLENRPLKIKSRMIRSMFLHAPVLISPVQFCVQAIKRPWKKENV